MVRLAAPVRFCAFATALASVASVAACSDSDKGSGGANLSAGGSLSAGGASAAGNAGAQAGTGGTVTPGAGGRTVPGGGGTSIGNGNTPGRGGTSPGSGGTSGAGGAGPNAGGTAGASSGGTAGASMGGMAGMGGSGAPYHDPGAGAFEVVPMADVASVCKLDVTKLMSAGTTLNVPWAVVRYGKLCWQHNADGFPPAEAYSTTKTLGATVAGLVSYQTRMIPRTGKKTGQFLDTDMALDWLDRVTYNQQAKVGHVLAMVAHDANLAQGMKSFSYDTVGSVEINTISDMLNAAIAQDKTRMGANLEEFTKKFLYTPLGMTKSTWSSAGATKVFAYTWTTDVYDMARVGLLINDYGWYGGAQLVDREWIYRMTHPAFEDSNTGFGYLTWLNSSSNWCSIDTVKKQGAGVPGPCAPVAVHGKYPHGLSESPDCGYTMPYGCTQMYDVGVWNAEGVGGQLIQGHRGLDMVIVARNAQPGGLGPGTAKTVWDAIRPAVIAGDPMFKGDETAFCKAYGSNAYAPDLH